MVSIEGPKWWALTVAPGPFSTGKERVGLLAKRLQRSVIEGARWSTLMVHWRCVVTTRKR